MSGATIQARALAEMDRRAAEALRKGPASVKASDVAVRLIRGDAVTLEPVRWLWPGFLQAGVLTILGGAPGCGKTTIALSLAATVTCRGTWPNGARFGQAGDVLIWSGEDAHPVIAARLKAAGADMKRVHFIDGISGDDVDGTFDPAHDMPLLEQTAEKLAALRLLILDPIVSAVLGDSNKNAEVRRALQPVVGLAHRLGCAVLGITHFTKGTAGRDPVERITGSLAFGATARLVLVAAKVKSDDGVEPRRVFMKAKANDTSDEGGFAYELERVEVAAGVEGQRVRWLDALEGSARDVLAEAEADDDQADDEVSALDDACQFLLSELSSGPKAAKYLLGEARQAGHSERTLKRAKARLGVDSRKTGSVWEWAVTPKSSKDAKSAKDSPSENVGKVGTLGRVGPDTRAF